MRALFSLVGLLVVVAIVMLVAKRQLQAVAPSGTATSSNAGGAAPTVPEQSRGVQQKVLQDINQSLQQGTERSADTKP